MLDEKIYGKWQYDVISSRRLDMAFAVAVERALNDRWQIHGTPFLFDGSICQTVVKFIPPEQPPKPEFSEVAPA